MPNLTNIQSLLIDEIGMTDIGFCNLSLELHNMKKLNKIQMSSNKLTNKSMDYLKLVIDDIPLLNTIVMEKNKFKKLPAQFLIDKGIKVFVDKSVKII